MGHAQDLVWISTALNEAQVGASRSEVMRDEWDGYRAASFTVVPMGSVAYEIDLVASGRLDATWTRSPKNEWDITGGAALLAASGGWAAVIDGSTPGWNNRDTLVPGFIATTPSLRDQVSALLL